MWAGVNFINVLRTAFTLVDLKSVRTQSSRQYLFTLYGSTSVKAVHRTLMKSTPDLKSAKKTDSLTVFFELLVSVQVKALRKMMVKLAPDIYLFIYET